jgi:hypothetical protein
VTERRPAPAQHRGRLRRPGLDSILLLAGIAALVAAQLLPAYRADGAEVFYVAGFTVTYSGWGALLGEEPILLLGWTANLWLVVALIARLTRHANGALVAAIIAELTAAVGFWALATFETSLHVVGLEIGAWVWLTGVTLVVGGVSQWGVRQLARPRP